MAGLNKPEIIKFIQDEIKQTEEALAFVEAELVKGSTKHSMIYRRKKAEYEGVLWAYNAVLDVAEGREADADSSDA
jgi:hypothetical protein